MYLSKNKDETTKNTGNFAEQDENGKSNAVLFRKFSFSKFRVVITADVVQPYPIKILNRDFPVKPTFFKTPSNIKAIRLIKPHSSIKLKKNINKTICGMNESTFNTEPRIASLIIVFKIILIFVQLIIYRILSAILFKIDINTEEIVPPIAPNVNQNIKNIKIINNGKNKNLFKIILSILSVV